nr:tripartite motif-containing protein 2 [Crassostrea gigas]
MSESIFQLSNTAQHFLECGTENCEWNCQFYCNDCHLSLCEQCRDEHQKSPDTKNHQVVPYQQRKRQLPEEKCQFHKTRVIDIFCKDCHLSGCSKCAIQDHQGHVLLDLEVLYSEKIFLCLSKISQIDQYFVSTTQDQQNQIKKDVEKTKNYMDTMRTLLKSDAESLKRLVDEVMLKKLEECEEIEQSLIETLNNQDKVYENYNSYLNDLRKELYCYISDKTLSEVVSFVSEENFKIKPIPVTTKPTLPIFAPSDIERSDDGITKLLGKLYFPDIELKIREIKPMELETVLQEGNGENKMKQSDMKRSLSLCSDVTEVREFKVKNIKKACHFSLNAPNEIWVSDGIGRNLVETDLQGNESDKIYTVGGYGYHTVTLDRDLIYTDGDEKAIFRVTQDKKPTQFIKTGDWAPISIHSSNINGDILVGMVTDEEAKVTRYNKIGKEIHSIESDYKGEKLYSEPHYITENINGDICASDYDMHAVVVVNKIGQHRFTYTGCSKGFFQMMSSFIITAPEFLPYGICTDALGHILVCDFNSNAVHLLDQEGQFLSLVITEKQDIQCPLSVCVDDENNLYVGQQSTNTVKVFQYLK